MADEKLLVPEHDELIKAAFVEHYEEHEKRKESAQFRHTKKAMHDDGLKCWVGNGRCVGHVEIHHNIIEWSAETEVDLTKVKADYPEWDGIDGRFQMIPLCEKHHRWKGFGKHTTPEPIWKLQRYMKEEALDDFERAVFEKLYTKEEQMKHGYIDVKENITNGDKTP
jgi:hypothetical protein